MRSQVLLASACLFLVFSTAQGRFQPSGSGLYAIADFWAPGTPHTSNEAQARKGKQDERQCFDWTLHNSIAREDFDFPSAADRSRQTAKKGELIPFKCDGIICPNPPVANCYMNEDICGPDEWCMLEDQIRFGPWAMVGEAGETPNFGGASCADLAAAGFSHLFSQVCQNQTNWGPWLPMRGRCARYRKEQQSCNAYFAAGSMGPHYVVEPVHGKPPKRPLLCAPGLVCTGDLPPTPHTCVKARPPNVCYQGPWWDSTTWCKVGGRSNPPSPGGLSRTQLELAAVSLLIQLPIEVYGGPASERFWSAPPAERSRAEAARIVEVLWPEVYRGRTRFPLELPDPRKKGAVHSEAWNSTAAEAEAAYRQPAKLWSAVHTLVHNAPDPLSEEQAAASRALAVFLRQSFMCCNCRGFWSQEVLNVVGLPPDTTSRAAHKRWWWAAHNAASEHTASTRGGHPWIYEAMSDEEFAAAFGGPDGARRRIRCQNPWFLPYDAIDAMWDITDPRDE